MPQIKEYQQQVGAQAGFQTLNINPSIEGGAGRAMQQAGAAISNVGNMLMDVQQAKETAEASEKLSSLRLKYTQRVLDEVNTGTLSLEKLSADYDAEFEQMSQGYITRGADDYLRKSGKALKDSLAMDALKAESEITAVKIKNSALKTSDNYQQLLVLNPAKRDEIKKQFENDIRSLTIDGKLIDTKIAEKIIAEGNKGLDIAQFRGLMKISSDENLPALKDALRTSAFLDRDFDDETIRQLEKEVVSEMSGREIEANRRTRLEEKAKQARYDANMNKAYSMWENDQLSYNDVKELDLPWEYKERLKNIMKADTRREEAVNTSYWTSKYFDDIRDGKITDGRQIEDAYVRNEISRSDMAFLTKQLDYFKRPEGAQFKDELSSLNKFARSKLVNDSMGMRDPDGEKQYAAFQQEMMREFQEKRAQGISVQELLDPSGKSPNSLYSSVARFQRSTQEKMDSMIKSMNPQKTAPKFKSIDDFEASKK